MVLSVHSTFLTQRITHHTLIDVGTKSYKNLREGWKQMEMSCCTETTILHTKKEPVLHCLDSYGTGGTPAI